MKFEEAKELARKGKIVRRKSWPKMQLTTYMGLITISQGYTQACKDLKEASEEVKTLERELKANDWEVC